MTRQMMKITRRVAVAFAIAVLAAAPARAQEEERQGGSGDIKVHGHWTFDVRNADGSLASHREFENSLTSNGANVLSRLLGRVDPIVGWQIQVSFVAFGVMDADAHSATVSVPVTGPNAYCLVLDATFSSSLARNIVAVSTNVDTQSGLHTAFTFRDLLSSPTTLQAGQILQVTVVISFS